MGVAQPQQVHQPLHRAVLARRAVQRIENHVRLGRQQATGKICPRFG